ncbi:hypothetical protein [Zavarzinella formosa]|uniref:hypothetical protein n=1 Tax=Zavarzinella formosa TaxID=360055 RepID=UPI000308442B|nr:hypothetical protein [Zavarzinella formosa]
MIHFLESGESNRFVGQLTYNEQMEPTQRRLSGRKRQDSLKTLSKPEGSPGGLSFRERITHDASLTGHHLCAWTKRLGITPVEFSSLTGLSGPALQPLFLSTRPTDWAGAGLLAKTYCPAYADQMLVTGCIAHACRIGINLHGEPIGPPLAVVRIAVATTLRCVPPDRAWEKGGPAGEAVPSRFASKLVKKGGWPYRTTPVSEEEAAHDRGNQPQDVVHVPRNMLEYLEDILGATRGAYGRFDL